MTLRIFKSKIRGEQSINLTLMSFQSFDPLLESSGKGESVDLSQLPPPPGERDNLVVFASGYLTSGCDSVAKWNERYLHFSTGPTGF